VVVEDPDALQADKPYVIGAFCVGDREGVGRDEIGSVGSMVVNQSRLLL